MAVQAPDWKQGIVRKSAAPCTVVQELETVAISILLWAAIELNQTVGVRSVRCIDVALTDWTSTEATAKGATASA